MNIITDGRIVLLMSQLQHFQVIPSIGERFLCKNNVFPYLAHSVMWLLEKVLNVLLLKKIKKSRLWETWIEEIQNVMTLRNLKVNWKDHNMWKLRCECFECCLIITACTCLCVLKSDCGNVELLVKKQKSIL